MADVSDNENFFLKDDDSQDKEKRLSKKKDEVKCGVIAYDVTSGLLLRAVRAIPIPPLPWQTPPGQRKEHQSSP